MTKKRINSTPFKHGGTFLMNFAEQYSAIYEEAITECKNNKFLISNRISRTPPNERTIKPLRSIHYIGDDEKEVQTFYNICNLIRGELFYAEAGIQIDYTKFHKKHKL